MVVNVDISGTAPTRSAGTCRYYRKRRSSNDSIRRNCINRPFDLCPGRAQAQDSLDALISKLNLEQTQIDKIRLLFDEFTKKQDKLPTAVDEAMKHRKTIRQVITKASFNRDEAQQVSQQVASVVVQRMVNRLELRNQIFNILNSKQQQQYIQYVEQNLGTSE